MQGRQRRNGQLDLIAAQLLLEDHPNGVDITRNGTARRSGLGQRHLQ
jgi:hypothetical protein